MSASSQLPVTPAKGPKCLLSASGSTCILMSKHKDKEMYTHAQAASPGNRRENQVTGNYYGKQMYLWERKRQNGSCPVERDICEEVKIVRSWLRCVACLSPVAMVSIGPGMLPRHVWVHGPAACLYWCPWLLISPETERVGLHRVVGPAPHLLWP